MTRKHFNAIASAFAYTRPDTSGDAYNQWYVTMTTVASEFRAFNSAFDFSRFEKACLS